MVRLQIRLLEPTLLPTNPILILALIVVRKLSLNYIGRLICLEDNNRGITGSHGTSGTGNTGYGSGSGLGSTGTSTTAGPHSSNIANKADPRVDSDRGESNNLASEPFCALTTFQTVAVAFPVVTVLQVQETQATVLRILETLDLAHRGRVTLAMALPDRLPQRVLIPQILLIKQILGLIVI